jgi:hypothetical protein
MKETKKKILDSYSRIVQTGDRVQIPYLLAQKYGIKWHAKVTVRDNGYGVVIEKE